MMKHHPRELCSELSSQLPDYLDGDAKEAICREIEEHLAGCDDCRVVIDTLKKTISLYRAAPREAQHTHHASAPRERREDHARGRLRAKLRDEGAEQSLIEGGVPERRAAGKRPVAALRERDDPG